MAASTSRATPSSMSRTVFCSRPTIPAARTCRILPLARLPIDTDLGGTFGVVQEFNRLYVAALGSFDRAVYDPSQLTDGKEDSNADRNFNQPAGILRVGYDLNPGLKPFVQIQEDERIHDQQFDRSNLQRNSVGTTAQVGANVDLFGSLTGEMAGGWLLRSYKDPTLPDISGFIANGALIWQATPLTTAKLTAASEVYETIVDGRLGPVQPRRRRRSRSSISAPADRQRAIRLRHRQLCRLVADRRPLFPVRGLDLQPDARGADPRSGAPGLAVRQRARLHVHGDLVSARFAPAAVAFDRGSSFRKRISTALQFRLFPVRQQE